MYLRISATLVLTVVTAVLLLSGSTHAADGNSIEIRLLETGQEDQTPDPAIADIMPVLQRTLRFPSYKLLGKGVCQRKDGASTALQNGISVKLSGISGQSMNVEVSQKDQKLIQTKVLLIPGKPLVLGGISGPSGAKLILVLTTR